MSEPSRRVALVLCGAFNPITYLHLRLFEVARDHFAANSQHVVIRGIISPVHDEYNQYKSTLIDSRHRLEMCRKAVEDTSWIKISEWETQQNGWTRTAQVLPNIQQVTQQEEGMEHVKVKFLCGADLLESFAVPNLWDPNDIEKILKEFGLVVITREGSNPQRFIDSSQQLTELKDCIEIIVNSIPNDISSTKIREAVSVNKSIRYLLPDKVIEYITTNRLYK